MGTILALDYGTTALKAVLYDENLRPLAKSQREWTYLYPAPGRIELPAECYWEKTVEAMRELFRMTGDASPEAISVTGQAETLITLDDELQPLGSAIVWLDTRAQEECERFSQTVSAHELYRKTGNTGFDPVMPLLKLCWMKDHEPERFGSARWFLLLKEYIVFRLTGKIVGEYSAQSCSGYFDIVRCDYDDQLLALAGISREKLPPLHDSQYVVGRISPDAQAAAGLSPDTLVVNGLLDQCASVIGAGAVAPGQITETTGTVLAVGAALDRFDGGTPDMLVLRHGLKDKFLALPNCSTAGVLLKWFRDEFLAPGTGYDDINRAIEARGRSESGLLLLPHFAGYLSPVNNPQARGVIYGLSMDTGKYDVAHAIMEGVAFLLRENLELLERHGIRAERIISLGGGAKSRLWLDVKAAVCARALYTLTDDESTALGCAINACLALGRFTEADIPGLVQIASVHTPERAKVTLYEEKYRSYQALNERLGFNPPRPDQVIRAQS